MCSWTQSIAWDITFKMKGISHYLLKFPSFIANMHFLVLSTEEYFASYTTLSPCMNALPPKVREELRVHRARVLNVVPFLFVNWLPVNFDETPTNTCFCIHVYTLSFPYFNLSFICIQYNTPIWLAFVNPSNNVNTSH